MNVKFYMNRPDKPKTSIMVYITFEGQRIRNSSHIVINAKNWNKDKQRVKGSSMQSRQINNALQNFKAFVEKEYAKALALEIKEVKKYLKERIDEYFNPVVDKRQKKKSIIHHYRNFIESRGKDKQRYSDGIIKVYKATLRRVLELQKEHGEVLYFDDIDNSFYVAFTSYLSKIGLNDSSVGKHIKTFKTFMNDSARKSLTQKMDFREFKVIKREPETIALRENELEMLEKVVLKKRKALEKARDVFLVQCYTGLRFSDLSQITRENVDLKENTIKITTQKTKEKIIIPIHKKLDELLKKYQYTLPRTNNIVQNRLIKEVVRIAGIDDKISMIKYEKGKAKVKNVEKYRIITTHTARRTAITLLLKRGALPETVMKISGHRDRRTFQRYVRIAQNEAVNSIRNIWDKEKK